jgi:hypothetical protein
MSKSEPISNRRIHAVSYSRRAAYATRVARERRQQMTAQIAQATEERLNDVEAQMENLRLLMLGSSQQTLRLQETYAATLRQLGAAQGWIRSARERELVMNDQLAQLTQMSETAVARPSASNSAQVRALAKRMAERLTVMKKEAGGESAYASAVKPPPVLPDDAYFPAGPVEDQLDDLPAYQPSDPYEYAHFSQTGAVLENNS